MIEVVAEGVPAGLGAPIYGKLDAELAAALMSINAAKGVEIGAGFAAAALRGEENADEMRIGNDGAVVPLQPRRRHPGRHLHRPGRRRPLRVQADLLDPHAAPDHRPRPAGDRDRTKGRHDPCVGIRAVPVVEAMVACVLADHMLRHKGVYGARPSARSAVGPAQCRGRKGAKALLRVDCVAAYELGSTSGTAHWPRVT